MNIANNQPTLMVLMRETYWAKSFYSNFPTCADVIQKIKIQNKICLSFVCPLFKKMHNAKLTDLSEHLHVTFLVILSASKASAKYINVNVPCLCLVLRWVTYRCKHCLKHFKMIYFWPLPEVENIQLECFHIAHVVYAFKQPQKTTYFLDE